MSREMTQVSPPQPQLPPLLFASHFANAKSTLGFNELIVTSLEVNGLLLTMGSITILIDPILEGPLDFGIPNLYKATKRTLPAVGLTELLPPIDGILLTQGLEDHTHAATLSKLAQVLGKDSARTIPIVAPPSSQKTLAQCGFDNSNNNIQFVNSGDEVTFVSRFNASPHDSGVTAIRIHTTQGALVGPPWQARENGYILRGIATTADATATTPTTPSVYLEPHAEFNVMELAQQAPVDVVITPIVGQGIPLVFFELVHGPKDSVRLVQTLRPKFVVPLHNGQLDTQGALSELVKEIGSPQEFAEQLLLAQRTRTTTTGGSHPDVKVLSVVPGTDIRITV
jgi:L-ascorbate metabolism protein UlaG (beta-lactamase superfamily)